jgi:long-chain acyl-CoA synthetase
LLNAPASGSAPWHRYPGALARFMADLIEESVARLRPGGAPLRLRPWPQDCPIHESGLGLDSLERLSVAASLAEALHLADSGVADLLLARCSLREWHDVAAEGLARYDRVVTFRTSGSTGESRAHPHELAWLQQEVQHHASRLSGCRRVWTAVPAHHIYGFLFSVLLPQQLGATEVLDARCHTPQSLRELLRPGDLIVSHPLHWGLMARFPGRIPPGVIGTVSTAPCPDHVAHALLDAGLERLEHIYGSTETGGIGWRESPDAPYRLLPFWSRDPASIARLERSAADGSRHVRELPDALHWLTPDTFLVHGRRDAAVQVAGFNVYPARVREVLLSHPAVADVSVRLMRASEGERLKAFVVPRDGTDWDRLPEELERWADSRLSAPERPRAFTLGHRLPANACGKLGDWATEPSVPGSIA